MPRLYSILFEGRQPSRDDIYDAIETATETLPEEFSDDLTLDDFELRHLGLLSVNQLKQYDDIGAWMEDVQDEDELDSFRGREWALRAQSWQENPPPIIVVSNDNISMIGDGRGRVTYANYKNIPLDAWELVLKRP